MDIRDRRALKATAARRLTVQTYPPRQLALIHHGVIALVLLAVAGIDYYLNHQVGNTSGLAQMDKRSALQTAQMVLSLARTILLPFWQIGFAFCAIRMARGRQTQPTDLLEGFRRFRPVLRLYLSRGLFFILLSMICSYIGSFFYAFTPMGQEFSQTILEQLPESTSFDMMMSASMEIVEAMPLQQLWQMIWPAVVFTGVILAAAAVFFFYCFRFADFIVMDQNGVRGFPALFRSSRMAIRHWFSLLKLDLSFWWYYLLLVLAAFLAYLDVLLTATGISLPFGSDAAYFLFYALSLLAQAVLFAFAGSKLQTTWALCYDALLPPPPENQ